MTTKAEIVTQALSYLNESLVVSDFENGEEAQTVTARKFYNTVLEMLLVDIDWGFCGRSKYLSDVILSKGNDSIGDWKYSFKFPNDVLKIRSITGDNSPIEYEVANDEKENITVIYCNHKAPLLNYTARVEQVAVYPPYFRMALSWGLAHAMAMEITGKSSMVAYSEDEYKKALDKARSIDLSTAKSVITKKTRQNRFIQARAGK